jgi:hypothetical protein
MTERDIAHSEIHPSVCPLCPAFGGDISPHCDDSAVEIGGELEIELAYDTKRSITCKTQ